MIRQKRLDRQKGGKDDGKTAHHNMSPSTEYYVRKSHTPRQYLSLSQGRVTCERALSVLFVTRRAGRRRLKWVCAPGKCETRPYPGIGAQATSAAMRTDQPACRSINARQDSNRRHEQAGGKGREGKEEAAGSNRLGGLISSHFHPSYASSYGSNLLSLESRC